MAVYSKKLYTMLQKAKKHLYVQLTKTDLDDRRTLGYVQAMFDSEGAVHKNLARITLWNKDENKLKLVKRLLEKAGITCGKITRSRNVYGLPIYGKDNLVLFAKKIGFRHPVKRARLAGKGALAQP
ncbi:MAG: hypothetical protein B9J98_03405 [Candidatus Terraquivivens tikiterensis]|uniref:Homing endonuclease LAGLIDADG domain-containing protein n=1 Tax=Candidatus Terraquivivens tikiterensis TaxID=1980982 RepID=A0A2R7Y601_9ARCH|nr:MAG: hypothetical protein B9J98_03405 [Candidatus Terraquivivens tikiterensis]